MIGFSINSARRGKSLGCGGKLFLALFGGAFLAAGLVGTFFAGREVLRDIATRGWDQVPCAIVTSAIRITDDGYALDVAFRYAAGGEERRGATLRRGYHGSDNYADAAALLARYPEGADATCRVDRADSLAAVLELNGWSELWAIPFCLTFAAFGGVGLYGAWRWTDAPPPDGPVADGAELAGRGGVVFLIVCAVFFTIGAVAFGWGFLPALLEVYAARDWPAVPATVLNSRLQTHAGSGDSADTYRVDILYEYAFAGRTWRSARYQFHGGSTNVGVDEKRALVRRLRPGSETLAYVNPADPAEAVLERGLTWDYAFVAIPLAFMLFGLGIGSVLLVGWRRKQAPPLAASQRNLAKPQAVQIAEGEGLARVRTSQPKGCGFAFLIAFTVIWNLIVWKTWPFNFPGGFHWFSLVAWAFHLPFLLVGVGLIGLTAWVGLTLLNPTVEATIDPPEVSPGGTFTVSWTLEGRYDRVRRLTLSLEGAEETESGIGDDKSIDRKTFHEEECFATTRADQIERGTAEVTVPADAVPSVGGRRHRIVWKIRLRGEIPQWPDVDEAFQVRVTAGAG